jgi:hypothetical protein
MKKVINRKKLSPKGIVYLLGFGTAISLLGESSLYICQAI